MIQLQFPAYQPQVKMVQEKRCVFDPFRKKWVVFTPEEWVRQNFLQYLVQVKKYPAKLLAIEKELMLNDQKRRFDLLVYDTNMQPWMVVECKQMDEPLAENVLQQALQYNSVLQCQYLVVTNGSHTAGFLLQQGQGIAISELPAWGKG